MREEMIKILDRLWIWLIIVVVYNGVLDIVILLIALGVIS